MSTAAFDQRSLPAAAPTLDAPALGGVRSRLRKAASHGGDALLLVGVIVSIPFAIMAVGIPIALLLQLLLWIIRRV